MESLFYCMRYEPFSFSMSPAPRTPEIICSNLVNGRNQSQFKVWASHPTQFPTYRTDSPSFGFVIDIWWAFWTVWGSRKRWEKTVYWFWSKWFSFGSGLRCGKSPTLHLRTSDLHRIDSPGVKYMSNPKDHQSYLPPGLLNNHLVQSTPQLWKKTCNFMGHATRRARNLSFYDFQVFFLGRPRTSNPLPNRHRVTVISSARKTISTGRRSC